MSAPVVPEPTGDNPHASYASTSSAQAGTSVSQDGQPHVYLHPQALQANTDSQVSLGATMSMQGVDPGGCLAPPSAYYHQTHNLSSHNYMERAGPVVPPSERSEVQFPQIHGMGNCIPRHQNYSSHHVFQTVPPHSGKVTYNPVANGNRTPQVPVANHENCRTYHIFAPVNQNGSSSQESKYVLIPAQDGNAQQPYASRQLMNCFPQPSPMVKNGNHTIVQQSLPEGPIALAEACNILDAASPGSPSFQSASGEGESSSSPKVMAVENHAIQPVQGVDQGDTDDPVNSTEKQEYLYTLILDSGSQREPTPPSLDRLSKMAPGQEQGSCKSQGQHSALDTTDLQTDTLAEPKSTEETETVCDLSEKDKGVCSVTENKPASPMSILPMDEDTIEAQSKVLETDQRLLECVHDEDSNDSISGQVGDVQDPEHIEERFEQFKTPPPSPNPLRCLTSLDNGSQLLLQSQEDADQMTESLSSCPSSLAFLCLQVLASSRDHPLALNVEPSEPLISLPVVLQHPPSPTGHSHQPCSTETDLHGDVMMYGEPVLTCFVAGVSSSSHGVGDSHLRGWVIDTNLEESSGQERRTSDFNNNEQMARRKHSAPDQHSFQEVDGHPPERETMEHRNEIPEALPFSLSHSTTEEETKQAQACQSHKAALRDKIGLDEERENTKCRASVERESRMNESEGNHLTRAEAEVTAIDHVGVDSKNEEVIDADKTIDYCNAQSSNRGLEQKEVEHSVSTSENEMSGDTVCDVSIANATVSNLEIQVEKEGPQSQKLNKRITTHLDTDLSTHSESESCSTLLTPRRSSRSRRPTARKLQSYSQRLGKQTGARNQQLIENDEKVRGKHVRTELGTTSTVTQGANDSNNTGAEKAKLQQTVETEEKAKEDREEENSEPTDGSTYLSGQGKCDKEPDKIVNHGERKKQVVKDPRERQCHLAEKETSMTSPRVTRGVMADQGKKLTDRNQHNITEGQTLERPSSQKTKDRLKNEEIETEQLPAVSVIQEVITETDNEEKSETHTVRRRSGRATRGSVVRKEIQLEQDVEGKTESLTGNKAQTSGKGGKARGPQPSQEQNKSAETKEMTTRPVVVITEADNQSRTEAHIVTRSRRLTKGFVTDKEMKEMEKEKLPAALEKRAAMKNDTAPRISKKAVSKEVEKQIDVEAHKVRTRSRRPTRCSEEEESQGVEKTTERTSVERRKTPKSDQISKTNEDGEMDVKTNIQRQSSRNARDQLQDREIDNIEDEETTDINRNVGMMVERAEMETKSPSHPTKQKTDEDKCEKEVHLSVKDETNPPPEMLKMSGNSKVDITNDQYKKEGTRDRRKSQETERGFEVNACTARTRSGRVTRGPEAAGCKDTEETEERTTADITERKEAETQRRTMESTRRDGGEEEREEENVRAQSRRQMKEETDRVTRENGEKATGAKVADSTKKLLKEEERKGQVKEDNNKRQQRANQDERERQTGSEVTNSCQKPNASPQRRLRERWSARINKRQKRRFKK